MEIKPKIPPQSTTDKVPEGSDKVGCTFFYNKKQVQVVEVLEDALHVKNTEAPFDSFWI